jgi:hypothetical protein
MKLLELSPTTGLALFLECPRCFWLRYRENVHRPETIFPSLPGGIDRVMKDYLDKYRVSKSLPPVLSGEVEGILVPDQALMEKWRDWRTGPRYQDEKLDAVLRGALDDCLVDKDVYIPLDVKTRGSAPKDGMSAVYYQTQLDVYKFLLEKMGYKTADHAYLLYYFPESVVDGKMIKFETKVVKIGTNSQRAYEIFKNAVECYRGEMPKQHTECKFCAWNTDLLEYD